METAPQSETIRFDDELSCALEIAEQAGALVARHYREGTEAWEKSEGNPVTQADLEADELIRRQLRLRYPQDGLLTEESNDDLSRLQKTRAWIVDPIDGTREFTRGVPEFAVSIALVFEHEPVVGVVCNPIEPLTVWACKGGGTFANGDPSRVSNCRSLREARVVASRSEDKRGMLDPYRNWFGDLVPTGSIAWKLALIASGRADFNLSLKPKNEWDVCAGDLLVREAGGGYVDFSGVPLRYNQRDPLRKEPMISGSPKLLQEFLRKQSKRTAPKTSSD